MSEPEFCAALEEVKNAYLSAWTKTKPDQGAVREAAYYCFKAIADIEGLLREKALSARARDIKDEQEKAANGASPSSGSPA